MTTARLPPKLSRPPLGQVIHRERLFVQLDRGLTGSALWLQGMAGAGKTVLAASYLAARRLPAIWYQLDEIDADPTTFFRYLEQAWRPLVAGQRGRSLPVPSFECLADPAGIARECFRAFFAGLPERAAIVFDDYQALPPPAPLHRLISLMVSEAPAGIGLLLLSRQPPPAEFARWRVNGRLGVLGNEALLLTWDEFRALAALHLTDSPALSGKSFLVAA